jgi:two-component system, NarL family, response regulator DevR
MSGTALRRVIGGWDESPSWPMESDKKVTDVFSMSLFPPTQDEIRVFLIDDHELIRRGLRDMLEDAPGLEVTGEAKDAAEALAFLPRANPHVLVMDVRLPDMSGVELCREVRSRHPEMRVLMLTSFEDQEALLGSILAGASGYLLKGTGQDELLDAIRRVAAGQSLVDPAVTATVFGRLREVDGGDPLSKLSAQERRILELIAQGLTNREIAAEIHLAEQTVKNYVSSTLTKLGLRHRTEAALFATGLAHEEQTGT